MKDLTYRTTGLFTMFFANTSQGVEAWNIIAAGTQGTGKILTMQLSTVKKTAKKAGYSVGKEKASELTIDEILNELITKKEFNN